MLDSTLNDEGPAAGRHGEVADVVKPHRVFHLHHALGQILVIAAESLEAVLFANENYAIRTLEFACE